MNEKEIILREIAVIDEALAIVCDRMDTDVISGMESGMSTVLVLSGVSTRQTVETYAYQPNVILDGVGDIPGPAEQKKISNPLPVFAGSGLLIVISLRA